MGQGKRMLACATQRQKKCISLSQDFKLIGFFNLFATLCNT